jgi:hypothetical protein
MFARKKSLWSVALLMFVSADLVLLAGASRARSDEPPAPADAIKRALEKAKRDYSSKIDSLKKEVLQSIDNKIAAARKKKRERTKVPSLTAQKEAFERDPSRLPAALGGDWELFAKRMRNARIALAGAYAQAINAYTENAKDAEAGTVKAELQEFLQKTAGNVAYQRPQPADVPQLPPQQVPPGLRLDPKILINSQWNFTRRLGVINQSGAFKIIDGVIYHLDADFPIGVAAIVGPGQIHLSFQGHRKIAEGEAVVGKIVPGEFRGTLNFMGDTWGFSMSRR